MCLWRRSLQGSRPSHPQSLMVHFRQSHCGLLVKPQRCLTLPWGVSTRSKVTDHQNRTLCHQIGTGRPGHTWKAKMLWYWHTSWGWQKEWTISSSSSLKFLTWQPDKRFKTCDWRDKSPLKKSLFLTDVQYWNWSEYVCYFGCDGCITGVCICPNTKLHILNMRSFLYNNYISKKLFF